MKTVKINGKPARVFVLKETKDSLVYIPVKALVRHDYDILTELEKQGGEMLKVLSKHTLPNGRNALVQYDQIIQVMRYGDENKVQGIRLPKPEEGFVNAEVGTMYENKAYDKVQLGEVQQEQSTTRRKPGRPPGSKNKKAEEAEA